MAYLSVSSEAQNVPRRVWGRRGMLLNAHEFQNQMECEKWGYSPPFVYCKAFTPLNSAHRSSYDAFESAV
ncbi:hypothetical protein ACN38_g213 [Penicillium nordicum]|uniref:Uncharacterized protein n=1 Tax=Penicillium nordicum TaxID=229535 RepID=A0A0M8PAQ0_9EURO|nr:hypothetical protein ACN38_g213 [Penicillium nordicum]